MVIFWSVLGIGIAVLLAIGLIIGTSYIRIACAWTWQPESKWLNIIKQNKSE